MAFQSTAGSILGGASNAVDAAAMRAARLARFEAYSNLRPSDLVFSQDAAAARAEAHERVQSVVEAAPLHVESAVPAVAEQPRADDAVPEFEDLPEEATAAASAEAPERLQNLVEAAPLFVEFSVPAVAEQPQADDAVPEFEDLPEGALLRITAQVDLGSSGALVAAGSGAGETLPVALRALRAALDKAKEEQRLATEAIEAERAADRDRHAAEATVMTQALASLAPLRTGQAAERHREELEAIFGMLQRGADEPSEREPEFAMRAEQAAAAFLAFDAAARSHVAAGELHAIVA